jgi:Family of unknown function (DUF5682)
MLLPVRHHSPACARMVRDSIARLRPAAVLIEGPADFNERIGELFLGHRPPIAIYSYVAWRDGGRQGAYYPLCEYSPEWQATMAAKACGAAVRFIDLPFATLAREDKRAHRYADDRLRGSDYVNALCKALEVESFDDAWDLIAEQDPQLTIEELYGRVGDYCRCLRQADGDGVRAYDLRRERFMAAHIRAAWAEFGRGRVLAVTGGYHTSGLEALLAGEVDCNTEIAWPEDIAERGIALTPYSYERLDNLVGYDAGMPSPGFYHEAWRASNGAPVHVPLLAAVVRRLRELKQAASTADLIGIETCARSLASLRGHSRVWRRDLVDAITAALVKDDVHLAHPFILVMQEVLRGGERGRLADDAPLPPLVRDIQARLAEANLVPDKKPVERALTLTTFADADLSRMLHRLRVLAIPGFERTAGVDFALRSDLTALTETWRVRWMPEQDAQMIEASRYGSALKDAVAARLAEAAQGIERSSAAVALLLLDSVLAGVMPMAEALRARAAAVIHQDGDIASVAAAMDHLLYLYAWDDTLGARGSIETGTLLKEAFERATWLLESGSPAETSASEVAAVRLTRDVFERAEQPMRLDRATFAAVLTRVQADAERSPAQRGACAGALWSLRCADPEHIRRDLLLFASPEELGDFLTGLFALAREEAQGDRDLLAAIHDVVTAWNDDSFLTALPSLRLAFMYFTAREKVHLARSLFSEQTAEAAAASEPIPLAVNIAEAAQAMTFETMLFRLAAQYGVRLPRNEEPTP